MLSSFLHSMPKAELHVHLEGSVDAQTLLELAARHQALDQLPAQDVEGLRRWFIFRDFPHFVSVYMAIQSLIRTADDFATIVYRCGEDMAAQNICYRELTVTTYTHTDMQPKGLSIEAILDGLEEGRQRAKSAFGVEMRWIFDVPRNASFTPGGYDPRPAEVTLSHALAGRSYGVVGFGLGGYEVGAPPEPFAHAFAAAKEAGLSVIPHAGETVGPSSVWGAVNALHADRIGHGVRAVEDPTLLALLAERQIPLEVSLGSNIRLGIYRSLAHHPFPHLDHMGLLLTVNSDDPSLFNTTLLDEYRLLAETFAYNQDDLARIARNAFSSSAAEAALKQKLLAEFDGWLAENLGN
jgi:aminodeoxyfutalosine deaminase